MLSDFRSCPLRYYLRHVEGLQLRDAASNSHHLAWGAAFHSGLEHLYQYSYQNVPVERSGLDDPRADRAQVLEQAQDEFVIGYPTQLDPMDKVKTQDNGIRALELYVRRWAEEDRKWKVLEVEGPGQLVNATNIGIGELHTDLIVENLEHGGIYVVDHKTTGKQLGPWYWDQYNPNSQITYYIDYCQEKYGSCEGFIINAVSLQWRDEKKSNGANNVEWFSPSDPDMPWLAYSHHEERPYKGGPLGKAGPRMCAWGLQVNFERQVFNRTKGQIEQERRSTKSWIEKIGQAQYCSECGFARASCQSESVQLQEEHAFQPDYPFNANSCYSCEYRGGELTGGICRPGYEWPRDREIISLSYRQVCREIIMVPCPDCDHGFDVRLVNLNQRVLQAVGGDWTVFIPACKRCGGVGIIPGPRCQLDRDHTGTCAPFTPIDNLEDEILVEVSL
jgi:hypothetical protein